MSDWNNNNQPNEEQDDFLSVSGDENAADGSDSSTDIQALFLKYLSETDPVAAPENTDEDDPGFDVTEDFLSENGDFAEPAASDAETDFDDLFAAANDSEATAEETDAETYEEAFEEETDDFYEEDGEVPVKKQGFLSRLFGKVAANYGSDDYDEENEEYDEEAVEEDADYEDEYAEEYAVAAAGDVEPTEESVEEETGESAEEYVEEATGEYTEEATEEYAEEATEEYAEEETEDYTEEATEEYAEEETEEYAEAETEEYAEEETEEYAEEETEEYAEEETEEYAEEETEEYAEEETAEEPDDTDINLMVAFGMDDELNHKVGSQKAQRIRDKMADSGNVIEREPVEYEFTSPSQTSDIASAYQNSLLGTNIKLILCSITFVILLLFENIAMFGIQFGGAFDPAVYPVSYIMIGLCGGLIAAAFAFEQIVRGFRALLAGKPSVETLLAVFAICNIVYSIVLAFTAGASGCEPQLFNATFAFCSVLVLAFERISAKREIFSFNVIASTKPKFVLRRVLAANAPTETEAFETSSDVLKLEKTSFVDGFFSRSFTKDHSSAATIGFLSVVIPLAAILAAVIAGFMGDADPVRVAGMTCSAALPLSLLLAYALPFYRACRSAYIEDATIVGECSLSEYADASLISVDEASVFPASSVKVKNIRVFNNYRFDKVLYFAGSVFRKTGGPLGDVFSVAAGDIGCSEDVEFENVGDGCITATVDGRRVSFGSAEALLNCGFPNVFPDGVVPDGNGTRVMYMFRDDILVAELYVYYEMDPAFADTLLSLGEAGYGVSICSMDPNIDDELLSPMIDTEQYPVRVVKLKTPQTTTLLDRVDSGIVSRGTPNGLLRALSFCENVLHIRRSGERIAIASVLVTLILAIVLTLFGVTGRINSFAVTLYQLLLMLPAVVLSYTRIKS